MIENKDRAFLDTERLTRSQKESNDFKWYKEKVDTYEQLCYASNIGYGGISERKRMQVNYNLFNNIIEKKDFEYVCQPFGASLGELPATMVNRDISSYRIKSLLGMEMRKSFGFKILAVNPEATTRKEEAEANKIRQYVIDSIMLPIRQETEMKYQQEIKGRELTPQEQQEIQQKIQQEIDGKTPPEIRRYMKRDHQDPAEVQGQQLANYLIRQQDLRRKFNLNWKHACLSAYEIYFLSIVNNKPICKVVNPMRFNFDRSPDVHFIEDGEWAVAEFRMPFSEVIRTFDLTNKEIDSVSKHSEHVYEQRMFTSFFNSEDADYFDGDSFNTEGSNTVRVMHVQWKGLRKVGWLDYIDLDGNLQTKVMVDESYKLNTEAGDVAIKWEWIPETYEGYKIGTDIYKNMGPVKGQFRDKNDLYGSSKLSYYGAVYDDMNSYPTSLMDRMKSYQYLYNIIMYRIELLTASDKGKKILMNIDAIPESAGINVKQWQYFFESSPFMWYSTDEEGMHQHDVNTVAKTLDLSLVSDINKYIQLAEYLEEKCGRSIGVTDPVLGQTAVSERVSNNQQNLLQTSHILEPYFDLHNTVKKNVLQGLINLAKVAFADAEDLTLSYVLDDMSMEMFKLDANLLTESTLGVFVEDSTASEETRETIKQLAHAAMQNQKIELSDVFKVIKHSSIQEAEETLLSAEEDRMEREQANAEAERKAMAEENQKARDWEKEKMATEHANKIDEINTKGEWDIQRQAMLSVGFNEEKDMDNDGKLDVMEIAQQGIKAQIEMSKEARANRELDHKIENDKELNSIKRKELQSKIKSK